MSPFTPQLPPDVDGQVFVKVQAFAVGGASLPHRNMFQDKIDALLSERSDVPAFSFLITHPSRGRALFDMGIQKNAEGYPPAMQSMVRDYFRGYCEEDIAGLLRKGGIDPAKLETLILSHIHWDHLGDITPFTSADIVVGADTKTVLKDTYPTNPNGRIQGLPLDREIKFVDFTGDDAISPFATFDRAVDFYGDGSFYLVDAPGHMSGHMAGLARIAPNSFVLLAGDTCHHRDAYNPGVRLIPENMHHDIGKARQTVAKLTELNKQYPNVLVVLAHELQRKEEMPFFPRDLADWVVDEVAKRKEQAALGHRL